MKSVCGKAGQKLSAFLRISFKNIYKSKSQFSYCPLIWMFRSRQSNSLINKILELSLRISYKDQKTSFQNLLEAQNELKIHQRNLQVLTWALAGIKS